jgi:putative spermidine/putrescine transport system substrate-binding protein
MNKSWDQIVETAKGGEVNWFLWGGADHINQYVTEYVGGILKDQYNITLNRVPLTDTAAAVILFCLKKSQVLMTKEQLT